MRLGRRDGFFYDYDFGDGWEHEIVVESRWRGPLGLKHAVCLDGARSCPPEDVGGPHGYADLLRVLGDPSDEEHEHFTLWAGADFDPERFDLMQRNIALQRIAVR